MEAFLQAIARGDLPAFSRLLRKHPQAIRFQVTRERFCGAPVFHMLYAGDTPLHLAAAGGCVDMVQALLDAGADAQAAFSRRRATPLHYAAEGHPGLSGWDPGRQVETLRLLLDGGAAINAQDRNGATPLHRAVRTRAAAAVEFLLRRGADGALPNHPGSSAFHLAVQNTGRGGSGSPEARAAQRQIIAAFRAAGVSPDLRDAAGQTVRQRAGRSRLGDLLA